MASLEANLEVAGQRYPLVQATFGVSQLVGRRGRAATKVRYSAVEVTLDIPTDDLLLAWAADPAKRQAASLTFRDAATGSTLETLSLGAAYCVGYREEFVAGADGAGAYRCALGLSDPDGFTMKAGGPGAAFVAPAAGEHGGPGVAAIQNATSGGGLAASTPLTQKHEKASVIALATNVLPANWLGQKDLPSWTEEHKEARWAEYQRDKALDPKAYGQQRWDNSYETARNNNIIGLAREREYAKSIGATSAVLKTPFSLRQIDMYKADTKYCGQLKTGYLYLRKQEKIDLQKDRALIRQKYKVEYILEKGASKPLLDALKKIGATVKIGPQIL